MKKTIIFTAIALISSGCLLAQTKAISAQKHYGVTKDRKKEKEPVPKFYLRGGIGYAFQHAGQVRDIYGDPYNGTDNFNNGAGSYDHKKTSMTKGVQGVLGACYMLNDHVGVDLSASLYGTPKYVYHGNGVIVDNKYTVNTTISQYAMTPVFVMPALVMQNDFYCVNLYMRGGLALPLMSKLHVHEDNVYQGAGPNLAGNEEDNIVVEVKTKFAIGFAGAIGASFNIAKQCRVFAEANMLSLSLYPKEEDVKLYTVGRNNVISQNPEKIPFGLQGSTVNPNTGTKPAEAIPYSNIGITVGISYVFGFRSL